MSGNGEESVHLPEVFLIDDVLGNREGSTTRIQMAHLAAQILSQIGPQVSTLAELNNERNWPRGAMGHVLADPTASNLGLYRKTSDMGAGGWTRLGPLPAQIVRDRAQHTGTQGMDTIDGLAEALGRLTIPLTIVSHGNNDHVVELPPGFDDSSIGAIGYFLYTPTETNPQPDPSITRSGVKRVLRGGENEVLPANSVKAGVPLLIRQHSSTTCRVIGVMPSQLTAAIANLTAGLASGGSIVLANVAGTGEIITADMPPAYVALGITTLPPDAEVVIRAIATNPRDRLRLTVGGTTYELRSADGNPIPANSIVVTRDYRFRRTGTTGGLRMLTGAVSGTELEALKAADSKATSDIQTVLKGAVIPLMNIGGTGDAITAAIDPAFVAAGIAAIPDGAWFVFTPINTNLTQPSPTIAVAGTTLTIRNSEQAGLPLNFFKPGRPYLMRRMGSFARVMAGDFAIQDAETARLNRVTADALGGSVTLEGVGGTGDAITASIPTAFTNTGISPANVRRIAWVQPAVNTGAATININGQGAVGIFTPMNSPVVAGGLRAGRLYEAVKVGSRWLLVGDVSRAELDAALARDISLGKPRWPGDTLIPVIVNANGVTLVGYDPVQKVVVPGASAGGGGAAIEFVEPKSAKNAWMAIKSGDVIKYMSNQWAGRTIGFEEWNGKSIAETKSLAVGVVAFGGGTIPVLGGDNDYPYHITGVDGLPLEDHSEGQRAAEEYLRYQDARHDVLPTTVGITQPLSSITEAEALNGSTARAALAEKVSAYVATLAGFGKTLYIDRIHLALLEGSQGTSQVAADLHYAGVAQDMRIELGTITEQGAMPVPVVCQSFGTRTNGTSEVILAEGRLHWAHWALAFVVATPRYPFLLVDGMAALHTPEAAEQIAELQNLGAMARLSNKDWYCPSLEEAVLVGTTIRARFVSMTGALAFADAAKHGFALRGATNGVTITSASVDGLFVNLPLSAPPEGDSLHLDYAFGETGDRGDGLAANRGTLHDGWSYASRTGATLRRFAYSNRVIVKTA